MRAPNAREYYIVSAEKSDTGPHRNLELTQDMLNLLEDMGTEYQICHGRFDNVKEDSVIVFDEQVARMLAADYDQLCYMRVDRTSYATMHSPSGVFMYAIGEVTWANYQPTGDYTELNGRYLVSKV